MQFNQFTKMKIILDINQSKQKIKLVHLNLNIV